MWSIRQGCVLISAHEQGAELATVASLGAPFGIVDVRKSCKVFGKVLKLI